MTKFTHPMHTAQWSSPNFRPYPASISWAISRAVNFRWQQARPLRSKPLYNHYSRKWRFLRLIKKRIMLPCSGRPDLGPRSHVQSTIDPEYLSRINSKRHGQRAKTLERELSDWLSAPHLYATLEDLQHQSSYML